MGYRLEIVLRTCSKLEDFNSNNYSCRLFFLIYIYILDEFSFKCKDKIYPRFDNYHTIGTT